MSNYNLLGNAAVVSNSPTVTGTGTLWESYLQAGDQITIAGTICTIASVPNDTTLILSANYPGHTTSAAAYSAVIASQAYPISVLSVPTLAELRRFSGPSPSSAPFGTVQAAIACYATPGDNGGGVFYWTLSNTADDDNGTIIVPTGGPTDGAWLRVLPYGGYVTPAMFGASPGNNTDNTAAFLSAFNSGYTSIMIDEGVYNFITSSTALTVSQPNLKIEGVGNVVLSADTSHAWSKSSVLLDIQASGTTLRNLQFSGATYTSYVGASFVNTLGLQQIDVLLGIKPPTGTRLSDIVLENITCVGGSNGIQANDIDRLTLRVGSGSFIDST